MASLTTSSARATIDVAEASEIARMALANDPNVLSRDNMESLLGHSALVLDGLREAVDVALDAIGDRALAKTLAEKLLDAAEARWLSGRVEPTARFASPLGLGPGRRRPGGASAPGEDPAMGQKFRVATMVSP